MRGKFVDFKGLKEISFGVVSTLILLWAIFNAFSFVPEGAGIMWTLKFLGFGVFGVYSFGREDVRSKLSQISFFKAIPIFLLFFVVTLVVMYFLLGIANPFPETILSTLKGVPVWLQIINAFVFATIETSFFCVFLLNKWGVVPSALVAGGFHILIWNGTVLQNFFGATLLFLAFNTVYYFTAYRKKKENPVPTIAVHTAYNFLQLGLLLGITTFKYILPLVT